MGRAIQTEIKDVIADELLFGELSKGGIVTVDLAGKSKKGKKIPLVSESGNLHFHSIQLARSSSIQS